MNIDAINTFLLLTETGNFSRVAEKSNLTQSTVSARIKTLEDTLDTQLFERKPSGVLLTDAGHKFYKYAVSMSKAWQESRQEIARASNPKKMIGLGLHMTMWRRFMPDWLTWMENQHPEFALHVEADYSERLVDYISEGVLDLAITHMPSGLPGMVVQPFMEDELVMVSRHLLDIGSCKPEAYIFVDWSYGYREEHQEKLPEFVRSKINIGFSEIALEHLYVSDCYAYMPRAYISDDLSHERLYIVKGAPILSRPSYLVYAKSSINSDVVKMAVEGLRASNREMHLKR